MMNIKNKNGVSLIAAIFIITVLGFMGVMFLTMISTGSFTAVNDIQSAQALYIAEGGVEYEQYGLAQNLDWYRSTMDPFAVTGVLNLGAGSFTASSFLPATKLRSQMTFSTTSSIRVYSINRFSPSGCIRIDDEFISYGGVGTTAAACNPYQPPCFTVITRAAAACNGGGTRTAHTRGDAAYPLVQLGTPMAANCSDMASLTIGWNQKFLSAGTLDIEGEEVRYSGSSVSGVNMILTGLQRCLDAASQITPPAHIAGAPVTPVLIGGDSADLQSEVTSTGAVGAAVRVVKKTVQRN
jgi:hypothetical protein